MDGTTRCPHCDTRFKIAAAQLQAHQGQVRCGHCFTPFDARPAFIADEPHPQLELHGMASAAPIADSLVSPVNFELSHAAPVASQLAQDESPTPHSNTRSNAVLPISVLALLMMLQLVYVWRADLAARIPASKPWLQSACAELGCVVGLPQNSELITIESSNLEADTHNLISLNVLLRSHASYALALPDFELTLNDEQELPVARRIFKPAEYLPVAAKMQAGLPANQEMSIKVWLELRGLNPSGYRLVLIYPQP